MDKKHELDKARKWGMTKWVRPIMDIMMDGTAGKGFSSQTVTVKSLSTLELYFIEFLVNGAC
jgi:hypothetical protein